MKDKIVDAEMAGKSMGYGPYREPVQGDTHGTALSDQGVFCLPVRPYRFPARPRGAKKTLDNLELLVSIDVNYSETGWYSDVILPEATYLERSNILSVQKGPKPSIIMRKQAISPRYDSKPAWEIFKLITEQMGSGKYFPL